MRTLAAVTVPNSKKQRVMDAPSVTKEGLTIYMRNRLQDRSDVWVTDLKRIGIGLSKETYSFTFTSNRGQEETLIMRKSPAVHPCQVGAFLVDTEYEALNSLHKAGFPVPEPLWVETGNVFDGDFMVMRTVEGALLGDPLKTYAPIDESFFLQAAEFLARLHALNLSHFSAFIKKTGIRKNGCMTAENAVRWRLKMWRNYFEEHDHFPSPQQSYLFEWLERNVPRNKYSPVLVHGDFTMHNILADDGRISAVLDWEHSHIGDPAEDLLYFRPTVDAHYDWNKFMKHYLANGGVLLDEASFPFFECMQNAIVARTASIFGYQHEKGETDSINAVMAGLKVCPTYQHVAWQAVSEVFE